jgi:hypothetical protein
MTTLGLLHLLWETTRLNHFYANGRERSWFPVTLKITGVAKEIKVGRSFIGDQLVILTPGGRERDFNSVAKVLEPFQKPTYQRKHRLLVSHQRASKRFAHSSGVIGSGRHLGGT